MARSHNWDRSHDWVLERFWHDEAVVTIRTLTTPPSTTDLIALRRVVPDWRQIPPADVRDLVTASGGAQLGPMSRQQADRVADEARRQGLRADVADNSHFGYLAVDRTTMSALLIEDEIAAAELHAEMLSAGVPVEDGPRT